jgi:hypothetical protein
MVFEMASLMRRGKLQSRANANVQISADRGIKPLLWLVLPGKPRSFRFRFLTNYLELVRSGGSSRTFDI